MTRKFNIIAVLILCFALLLPVSSYALDLEDGDYGIGVEVTGGSGKATVTSPCVLTVLDGEGYATIEWSSPYYDYMVIDGTRYLPINDGGNSKFLIPIKQYDKGYKVIADTTAMSTAHEVEYMLTFHSDEIMDAKDTPQARARYSIYMACGIILLCIIVSRVKKYRYKQRMKAISR